MNIEAALALGRRATDQDVAFTYLAAAAASQEPAVLEGAGEELLKRILKKSGGRWNPGGPYATWLIAFGGQAERIASLQSRAK